MVQESGDAHMTDGAPKRIWAWITGIQPLQGNAGLWRSDEWTITDDEYILAAEHDRIVAEKDARITVMRKALLALEQHEASHFRGPDAEKNRRQSYRGVKRAVRAALKGDSDE